MINQPLGDRVEAEKTIEPTHCGGVHSRAAKDLMILAAGVDKSNHSDHGHVHACRRWASWSEHDDVEGVPVATEMTDREAIVVRAGER